MPDHLLEPIGHSPRRPRPARVPNPPPGGQMAYHGSFPCCSGLATTVAPPPPSTSRAWDTGRWIWVIAHASAMTESNISFCLEVGNEGKEWNDYNFRVQITKKKTRTAIQFVFMAHTMYKLSLAAQPCC